MDKFVTKKYHCQIFLGFVFVNKRFHRKPTNFCRFEGIYNNINKSRLAHPNSALHAEPDRVRLSIPMAEEADFAAAGPSPSPTPAPTPADDPPFEGAPTPSMDPTAADARPQFDPSRSKTPPLSLLYN